MSDLDEIAERYYPRRTYYAGFTPPGKKEKEPMTTRNDEWPEIPGGAEARRQEAEDKATNDRLDRLTNEGTRAEREAGEELIADAEAAYSARQNTDPGAMVREMQVRAGLLDPDEELAAASTSTEIAAIGKRTGWTYEVRAAYLDAIGREKVARRASTTYRGAA